MLQRKRHLNGGFTVGLQSFTAVLHFNFMRLQKVPFICSRLPETTLPLPPPPSFPQVYPGRGNFSLISLQNPTNRLQEDREPLANLEFTSFEQSPLVEPLHQSYIK